MNQQTSPNDTISQEKLDKLTNAWLQMVDCIVHDITGPLAPVRGAGLFFKSVIPKLVEVYKQAVQEGRVASNYISEKELTSLNILVSAVGDNSNIIFDFINVLNPYNTQLLSESKEIKIFSAKTCIANLLENYPFSSDDERKLVHFEDKQDFNFRCVPIVVEYLFPNLLKNALFHIQVAEKGEVSIWLEEGEEYNVIHFKDTSSGVHKLNEVFKRYFSKRNGQIVPGLGLCRLAILDMGGDVICESVEDKYAHFMIKFRR